MPQLSYLEDCGFLLLKSQNLIVFTNMDNIPLFKIYWDKKDTKAVNQVIESGRDWAIGAKIEEFETKLAKYVGAKYAVAFNSGTSGLHALLIAAGITEGDEVIVPSFTFIATANACLMVGAKPVFAEIENETYGLSPADVEKKITPKTKAIMVVHYGGLGCNIEEIKKIADKHHLLLLEDAAESLGAKVNGKNVGTFGLASMFSFCGPKVITTGEGGMIATDSKDIADKLKLLRSHGRAEVANYFSSSEYMDYVQLGYNFRMSNITAALGVSQLEKIGKIISLRQKNANYLAKKLAGVKQIMLPATPKGFTHIYQMFTIYIEGGSKVRDGLQSHLNKKGIGAKVYFYPIHLTSFYRNDYGYKKGDLPQTEKISDSVLTLPLYPGLTKKEMDYMAKEVIEFFKTA